MKIELAYPYEGHKPDSVIDIDDDKGAQMIRDGFARPHNKPAPAKAPSEKEA